jgi:MarR family transcriptional regulator, organic hydroperoxide resistance regulator
MSILWGSTADIILTSIYIDEPWHSMLRSTLRSPELSTQTAALRGLRAVIAALSQSARATEARTGITNAQLFLLQQLQAENELSINDLAARARTGQSAVSIIVGRLVRRGLVRRRRSAADARRASVSLTAAGRALARRAPEPPTARLLSTLGELEDRDLRALARGVNALARAMGVTVEAPAMLFERDGSARVRNV